VAAKLFTLEAAAPVIFFRPGQGGAQSVVYRNVALGLMGGFPHSEIAVYQELGDAEERLVEFEQSLRN
jgi:hypothetical protein